MTIEIPTAPDHTQYWESLRKTLKETQIETYYAVESHGHQIGWKSLTQLLTDKIKNHMDVIRERIDNTTDEIDSAKLRGRIDGLNDALQLITESNQ